jgi:CRP-like cAMP-binding protein
MADQTPDLFTFLENASERLFLPRSAILFRCGDESFGTFLVLSGQISVEYGGGTPETRCYGPGALIGLPATITKINYSMTATVVESGEFGFLSSAALESLIRDNPALSQRLLALLVEKVLEMDRVKRSLLEKGSAPAQESNIV